MGQVKLNCYVSAHKLYSPNKYALDIVDLSVVVLNYQGNPVVYKCLESIFNSSYSDYELIFVDNNSNDGSYEKSLEIINGKSNVIVIRNKENFGFTRGFDIGVKNSHGKYILLLNNDIILYPDALYELVRFMDENPKVGLAEGRIENLLDGTPTFSDPRISIFFGILNEVGDHVTNSEPFAKIVRVFSPVGVWPIIRKEVYDRIGGYDNDYVHFEEIRDLAARVWIFGNEVGYVYKAVTQHVGRLTEVSKNYGKGLALELYFHATKNQAMFFLKNYSRITIIKYYFPYLIIKTGDLFYTLFVLGKTAFIAKLDAYKWILKNISMIMAKRRLISKYRVVTDKFIMNHLSKVEGDTLLRLLRMRNAYDKKTREWLTSVPNSKE